MAAMRTVTFEELQTYIDRCLTAVGLPADDARIVALAAPFNLSGLPAASVPGGFVDGLPVGVQFIAAPWREDVIFQVAAQVETARPWFRRPPI